MVIHGRLGRFVRLIVSVIVGSIDLRHFVAVGVI